MISILNSSLMICTNTVHISVTCYATISATFWLLGPSVHPSVHNKVIFIAFLMFLNSGEDTKSSKQPFQMPFWKEQGRIHGYWNCMWVGRGSDKKGYSSNWAGAIMQKPPANAEKANADGTMDQPTDQHNGSELSSTRLKSLSALLSLKVPKHAT